MSLNTYTDRSSPSWLVIEYIKRNGSATIKELEDLLGVTTNAVRQHLQALQADGYVERRQVNAGVGRPHHAYLISAKANALFACHCDDLALTLLEEVFAMEGPDRTQKLLNRVGDRLASRYAASVQGEELQERVGQLAVALNERGVLTAVEPLSGGEDENVIVLHAYNCPYHELALEHRAICEMDEEVMRKVLGADVNLTACMMDGHRGCSFVVSKLKPALTA